MVTSINGRNLIKSFEGCKFTAYKDSVGVYTIGYGHTSGVKAGMKITKTQAETLLNQDIAKCEAAVNKYMKKYNFNQNEYDALVSFTFNLGSGNLDKLTLKGLRSKAVIGDKILAYNKAGGKTLSGLVKRRTKERALYITPINNLSCIGVDYSHVFNAAYYANKYSDLRNALGNDAMALFDHFLLFGMDEHRQAIATFNVEKYISYPENADVVKACTVNGVLDYKLVYKHYCEFGYKETRRAV